MIKYRDKYPFLSEPMKVTDQKWDDDIDPLVSISCITYNHKKYISKAIDSFLMQKTTFRLEILLHDDASSDGTSQIIQDYESKYPELVKPIIQKVNQYSQGVRGMSRTYNYPRAKGKYIALCEGDDYWTDPNKLQKQVVFMEQNLDYSLIFHNSKVIYEDNKLPHDFNNINTREYSAEEILNEWIIPTGSVLFRLEDYDADVILKKNYLYSDIILFLSLAEKGKVWGINDAMSVYRKHSQGISSNKSIESTLLYINHHKSIKNSFQYLKDTSDKIICKNYIGLSKMYIKELNPLFVKALYLAYKSCNKTFFKYFFSK